MTVIWDDRLITRSHAAEMCGTWEIKMDYPYLRCSTCDGNITRLPSQGMITSVDVLISAVVRHMSCNHEYSLSGSGYEDECGAPDAARINHSNRSSGHSVY